MIILCSHFPAPGVSHEKWVAHREKFKYGCVCVFVRIDFSLRNSLTCCVFSVFEGRRIRSQLTAHRPTKILCFCLFLAAKAYALDNFCSQGVAFFAHSAICSATAPSETIINVITEALSLRLPSFPAKYLHPETF